MSVSTVLKYIKLIFSSMNTSAILFEAFKSLDVYNFDSNLSLHDDSSFLSQQTTQKYEATGKLT